MLLLCYLRPDWKAVSHAHRLDHDYFGRDRGGCEGEVELSLIGVAYMLASEFFEAVKLVMTQISASR